MEFKTEVNQLLQLMIHSLYSNKEIFLRELISNASDALDKLNLLTVSDDAYKKIKFEPRIEIKFDAKNKILSISDNGIGMNEEDLNNNLGTIAKSGTKSFLQSLSGDMKKDSQLIGQFGVGFYSAFMVADKVEVLSKKVLDEKAFLWSSDASSYDIKEAQKDDFGTTITLHLKDEEFLNPYRIESIVTKYSNHIQFPIFMEKEEYLPAEDGKESKSELKIVQINTAKALWRQNKASLKQDDYDKFYEQNFHDSNKPLLSIHTKSEGKIEYNTLFYIPSVAPFDLYRTDYQSHLKLYVKRVFISDDDKNLLPTYLRFVRGIVDVEDLPLNVSREILQENIILKSVEEASVKKILNELEKLMNKDKEKYENFFVIFGKVLKEGLYGFSAERDKLLNLMLFKSLNENKLISLKEYKEKIKEEQKEIFYITGTNEALLKNSPLLESYKHKNIDVLILDDEIDSIIAPMLPEFEGLKFSAINKANEENKISEEEQKDFASLIAKFKEILKDEVSDVLASSRLYDSPCCIVYDKDKPDFAMQQLLKQMGQDSDIKPILELNLKHEILQKLKENESYTHDVAILLLNMAKLNEGLGVKNAKEFNEILNKFITKAL
ncbi:chaperone protein HtpG [Campylobacter avium LMG 24591]|uniref:Chaperone protein HtpG n=1 Tax=Campylobacter avium LMG 24591 TaxID=522484 RepID=A0A222MY79_9BACT|nr:molecular chaperone HtpG [Campylobacter avium]ASQ30680.1 chaperone protein HtpG [Campylobacter avium LMG 24591]OYD79776.1 chaperone protein HtpG [Campylobacter avium]